MGRKKGKSSKKKVHLHVKKRSTKKKSKKKGGGGSGILGTIAKSASSLLPSLMGAGDLIAKVTGFGDYKVSHNSIMMGTSVPSFRLNSGGVRVCHQEFLTDITGSVLFTLPFTADINPGLSSSFPWLAAVATNFEEYEMHGLVYEYRPSSGSAVATNSAALGIVVLATNYNVLDPPFSTKQMMESYEFSTPTVPFNQCIHGVECMRHANVLDNLFVRTGPVPAGGDQRFYDMGLFQVGTSGMQSAYTCGELHVTYDVSFMKPRIPAQVTNITYFHLQGTAANTCDATHWFGTSGGNVLANSNFPGVTNNNASSTGTIVLSEPGTYFIIVTFVSGTISTAPTCARGTNMVAGSNIFNLGSPGASLAMVQTNIASFLAITQTVVTPGTTTPNLISIAGGGTYTTGNTDVFIFPIPTGSLSANLEGLLEILSRLPKLPQTRLVAELATRNNSNDLFSSITRIQRPDHFEVMANLGRTRPPSLSLPQTPYAFVSKTSDFPEEHK